MALERIYLRILPTFSRYNENRVSGFKVAGVTARRPQAMLPGIVVTLSLRIDDEAFLPIDVGEQQISAEHVQSLRSGDVMQEASS